MNAALYDFDILFTLLISFFLFYFFDGIVGWSWRAFKKSFKWSVCCACAITCVLGVSFTSPNYRRLARRISQVFGSGRNYFEHFLA
jgi:hypothetical protein